MRKLNRTATAEDDLEAALAILNTYTTATAERRGRL